MMTPVLKPDSKYRIRSISLVIALCLIVHVRDGFSQQQNVLTDPNVAFMEQQKQLNAQLIDYARQQVDLLNSMRDFTGREQYGSAWEFAPDMPPYQRQIMRSRGDDEFNYSRGRLDSVRLKTMEAESRKNELKMKVSDYNKGLPAWWVKAEADFSDERRKVFLTGLRR